MELEQEPDVLTRSIQVLGIFFLGAGFAALLVLLTTVMQLMGEPESVFSIQVFTEFLESDAPPVSIVVEGREALVNIDPTLRKLLVIFVGAITVLALGSLLHACIGGGLSLLKFARKRPPESGG